MKKGEKRRKSKEEEKGKTKNTSLRICLQAIQRIRFQRAVFAPFMSATGGGSLLETFLFVVRVYRNGTTAAALCQNEGFV